MVQGVLAPFLSKINVFCKNFAVWGGDPKRFRLPNRSNLGIPQINQILRKSSEIKQIVRISIDFEQPSRTPCEPIGRSNVFQRTSKRTFRVLQTNNNRFYLFSFFLMVRTGLSAKWSTLSQDNIETRKPRRLIRFFKYVRTVSREKMWPASLHSVPFTECVPARVCCEATGVQWLISIYMYIYANRISKIFENFKKYIYANTKKIGAFGADLSNILYLWWQITPFLKSPAGGAIF